MVEPRTGDLFSLHTSHFTFRGLDDFFLSRFLISNRSAVRFAGADFFFRTAIDTAVDRESVIISPFT